MEAAETELGLDVSHETGGKVRGCGVYGLEEVMNLVYQAGQGLHVVKRSQWAKGAPQAELVPLNELSVAPGKVALKISALLSTTLQAKLFLESRL